MLFIAHFNYGGRIFITSPNTQWNLEENVSMIIVNIVPADILASLGARTSVVSVIITAGPQISTDYHLGGLADHIDSHDGNRFRYNIKWWVSIPLIPTGRNWRWNCSYMMTSWHGNVSGVTGRPSVMAIHVGPPSQRDTYTGIDILFDASLKISNKQLCYRWFETPGCPDALMPMWRNVNIAFHITETENWIK